MADPGVDHATHDLEVIAALADDRTEGAGARRAQAGDCGACAQLLDDLRLLARASAILAVPARTRDFRLDPITAASLASTSSEPELAPSRLGVDMTSPATDHATHDTVLIAAHLDGGLDAADQVRVDDWLARCGPCATLRDDLAALAIATRTLPTPLRPRDFSLSPEDARRARSGGWRRLIATFGSPRDTFSRPLAVGLTTLGIAGLVVANIPSGLSFGSAASSGASSVEMSPPSMAPVYQNGPAAAGPSDGIDTAAGGEITTDASAAAPVPTDPADTMVKNNDEPVQRESDRTSLEQALFGDQEAGGPSWLVIGSAILLVVGLTLALARWASRRLGDG